MVKHNFNTFLSYNFLYKNKKEVGEYEKLVILMLLMSMLTACGKTTNEETASEPAQEAIAIELSDDQILVDGEAAGTEEASVYVANVIIADGTENTVNGSYVARIYEPDSVVLNEDETEVEDAKKLHKYDAAFYSRMTMNVNGEEKGDGVLIINAENEGLDSELHLTINGGNININSGNDGINTNEDGVSVTTVNGGTVIASGHMLDQIEEGGQTYAVFNFAEEQDGSETITLKDEDDKAVMEACPGNSYSILVYSSSELEAGTYTLWSDEQQMEGQSSGMMGGFGMPGGRPGGMPNGEMPEGMPEDMEIPEGGWNPENMGKGNEQESSTEFQINDGANMFSGIKFV